jgi:toxin ParE1/3/4
VTYTIIRHRGVESDLLEITAFIASYAGLDIGKAKVDEITGFISNLAHFPKIGSVRSDVAPGFRAVLAGEKAVVCFSVDDTLMQVFVYCIGYAGSDWLSRVKDRL